VSEEKEAEKVMECGVREIVVMNNEKMEVRFG
jgi:hypothetical protein